MKYEYTDIVGRTSSNSRFSISKTKEICLKYLWTYNIETRCQKDTKQNKQNKMSLLYIKNVLPSF